MARICQARDAGNNVTRDYYAEGELVPGAPAQPYYYGPDQIGSVRRVFESATSAPAYSYDPYGNALQGTASATDFNYAGMFYNADSGLYLTQYRAYDPAAGRWLSRDPIGEGSDPEANLYAYVGGNPVVYADSSGLWQVTVSGGNGAFGGILTFGYNSGQWNAGAWGGTGAGLSARINPFDTGCHPAGFQPTLNAQANWRLGGIGGGAGAQGGPGYEAVNGSVALGQGANMSANWGNPPSGPLTMGPTFGWGSSAAAGVGGQVYW